MCGGHKLHIYHGWTVPPEPFTLPCVMGCTCKFWNSAASSSAHTSSIISNEITRKYNLVHGIPPLRVSFPSSAVFDAHPLLTPLKGSCRAIMSPIQAFCGSLKRVPGNALSYFYCERDSLLQGRAGAAELGGIPADENEKLRIERKKKKKFTVAGVDQEDLVDDPQLLADEDSLFLPFHGIHIHFKVAVPEKRNKAFPPLILLHGFGASSFSWNAVMKPLSNMFASKVLAFDRPAFGLTSRAFNLPDRNPYSLDFSLSLTFRFFDVLETRKAVLVGHSAGCLVALNSYFEDPERVAALVLVAPAILAQRNTPSKGNDSNLNTKKEKKNPEPRSDAAGDSPFLSKIKIMASRLWKGICLVIISAMKKIKELASACYRALLSSLLRSTLAALLVRFIFDKFGRRAIRYSWYDEKKIPPESINGYTKPLRCRGWERAILEFTLAVATGTGFTSSADRSLQDISCPVLVVTGDTDRLVPAWNAERVAEAIRGSTFRVIKNCGHLPHEEKPQEFLEILENFFEWAFGSSSGNHASIRPAV